MAVFFILAIYLEFPLPASVSRVQFKFF